MVFFDGSHIVRSILELQALRDPSKKASIEAALADPNFVASQVKAINAGMVGTPGGLLVFLQLFLTLLPQILAIIEQLFPVTPPVPTPTPAPTPA